MKALARPRNALGEMLCEDFAIGREGHGLAHAQEQPHDQKHFKAVNQAGGGGGDGPDEETLQP